MARAFSGDDAHRCLNGVTGTAREYLAIYRKIYDCHMERGNLTGRSREITSVMQRRAIDILCPHEVRWTE